MPNYPLVTDQPGSAARNPQSAIRLWPLLLLVAGLPSLVIAWTAASTAAGGNLPAAGGSLVEGVVGATPDRISPLFAAPSGPERDLVSLIFSGLTRPGPNGEPQPDLAESWLVSTDATSFTFVLRRNVTWQDGAPFTADDVLFTAQAFSAPGVKGDPATAEVWRRARVEKRGPSLVVFQFDAPFAPFLAYSAAGILPQHLLGKDSPEQLVDDPFNRKPVGTGPFRLQAFSSSSVVMRANPGFYLGVPYLRLLSLHFLADAGSLFAALRDHSVQSGILGSGLPASELDALRASGDSLIGGLRPAYSLVYLNLNLAQFQDQAVRQALSLATDRERIVQTVMTGQATPANAPLPPGTWNGADTTGAADLPAARMVLQQAGWSAGRDGVLARRGLTLSFALQTTPDPQRQALALEVASQWRAIGVDARVELVEENALLSEILLPHKYEAVLYGWDPGPDPDPFPAWHSSQQGEQGRNLSSYVNARADQLLETARQTAELDDRGQLYSAFTDLFRQDVPAIVLFFPRYVYVVPKGLNGIQLGLLSSTSDRFTGVEEWSLTTRRN